MGVFDTHFSHILQRYQLELIFPCTFEAFKNISLHVRHNVDKKHSLFLPTMAGACGAWGSQQQVQLDFESSDYFLCLLGVSDTVEAAAFRRYVKRRKDRTIVKTVGGGQMDNANRITPLNLFIGHTCRRNLTTDDDDISRNEKVDLVSSSQSVQTKRAVFSLFWEL